MKARLTVYCWWNHLLEWHFSFYIVWLAESVTDIHGGLFTVRSVKILFAPQKSPPRWLCPYCLKALRLLSLGIGHGYPMTNFQKKKKVADVQPHGPWPQCQGFCEDEQGFIKRKCAAVILSPTSDLHVGDWRTQILGLRHAAT